MIRTFRLDRHRRVRANATDPHGAAPRPAEQQKIDNKAGVVTAWPSTCEMMRERTIIARTADNLLRAGWVGQSSFARGVHDALRGRAHRWRRWIRSASASAPRPDPAAERLRRQAGSLDERVRLPMLRHAEPLVSGEEGMAWPPEAVRAARRLEQDTAPAPEDVLR